LQKPTIFTVTSIDVLIFQPPKVSYRSQ